MSDLDIDLPNAKLAYTIIQSLLEAARGTQRPAGRDVARVRRGDLKALTATTEWQNYLESKRNLESTKAQIELFTAELRKLENA